jgi:hypothetical protein
MPLAYLTRQYQTAWSLLDYHLASLTTQECLWRPAEAGLHVHLRADGSWGADWPTHEGYDLGPSSIGWLTWHLVFWWSMVIDHSFGEGKLAREGVPWPGSADALREQVGRDRLCALLVCGAWAALRLAPRRCQLGARSSLETDESLAAGSAASG